MSAHKPTPNEVLLNATKIADQGLRYISTAVEATLRGNYNSLATPGGLATVTLPEATFAVKGYYVSRKLIEALLAHDFAHYEGMEISFGREPAADGGRLVLLFRGAYKETAASDEADFKHESAGECMSTYEPVGSGPPDPPIIRNPPYGK
jgi:hypothetical protein